MQVASYCSTHLPPPVSLDPRRPISPLMLSDSLISLAQDADRAGYPDAATTLIGLAHLVLDERPLQ